MPYDKKKVEEMEKLGSPILMGTPFNDLYEYINALEVQTGYNHTEIVRVLKLDAMQATGRIQINEGESNVQEKND